MLERVGAGWTRAGRWKEYGLVQSRIARLTYVLIAGSIDFILLDWLDLLIYPILPTAYTKTPPVQDQHTSHQYNHGLQPAQQRRT